MKLRTRTAGDAVRDDRNGPRLERGGIEAQRSAMKQGISLLVQAPKFSSAQLPEKGRPFYNMLGPVSKLPVIRPAVQVELEHRTKSDTQDQFFKL